MNIKNKDCFEYIKKLKDQSIHSIITDPPYFLDSMCNEWSAHKRRVSSPTITNLPSGMKFDTRQSLKLEEFMYQLGLESMRILKPGGFLIAFSAPRLYHGLAKGLERAGFEIREQLVWSYKQSQVKAMRMDHFIDKCKFIAKSRKAKIKRLLKNHRTPQIRTLFEPICVAMKPLPKGMTFVHNWSINNTGLLYVPPERSFPTSILEYSKPNREEKKNNHHPTVKPIDLMKDLIEWFCPHNGNLLDPFLGSGTTAVATKLLNKEKGYEINMFGCEKNKEYYKIIKQRIKKAK